MLRTFGLEADLWRIRLGRDRLMQAGQWMLTAVIMFILSMMRPAAGLAPFASAYFAGALGTGASCAALVAGGLAGSLMKTGWSVNLNVPVGMAVILGGGLVWDFLRKRVKPGTSPPEKASMYVCGVLSGLGVLFPGLVYAGGTLWPSVQTVTCAIAAAAAAPFIRIALEVKGPRRYLMQEERMGMMILLCSAAGGLLHIAPMLAAGFGAAAVLVLHTSGSLASIAVGGALMLSGCDGRLPGMLCLGGMCGQLLTNERRMCRTGAAMLCMLAGGIYLQAEPVLIAGTVLGAGLCAVLPEKWMVSAGVLAGPVQGACDPDRLAAQLRGQVSRKLLALGDAFGELAECYLAPGEDADEQYLIGRMRERLCTGCPGYGQCWDGGSGAVRFLCGLVSEAVTWAGKGGEGGIFEEDMPPDVLRMCRRGRLVPERLENMLMDFALKRQAQRRRNSDNRLISAQFLQAKQLLEDMAGEQAKPIKLRNRQSARAGAILEGMGIPLREVMMIGGPRAEMIAVLKEGRWTREMARAASERLTRSFGRTYIPEGDPGKEMRFVRSTRYWADTGAGCVSRDAGVPSGDSHIVKMIDDERMLILICDGMGSGEAAARESAAAVKLLARFMSAGASRGLAIETVNAMLLSRGSEDMFATADMLILDLSTGNAEFIKLAACPSLIVRSDGIYRVEGGRLPLGILERVQPAVTRVQLQPGDVILMASDGVMDAVDAQELYEDLRAGAENMPDMAQRVLALAEDNRRRCRRDDMTAICIRINLSEEIHMAV